MFSPMSETFAQLCKSKLLLFFFFFLIVFYCFGVKKLTCDVTEVEHVPFMAWPLTRPLKIDLKELKKLDFPAPTCPTSKTRASDTELIEGL